MTACQAHSPEAMLKERRASSPNSDGFNRIRHERKTRPGPSTPLCLLGRSCGGIASRIAQIAVFLMALMLAGGPAEMQTPVSDCIAFVVGLPFVVVLYWLNAYPPLILAAALADNVLWGLIAWAFAKRFEDR